MFRANAGIRKKSVHTAEYSSGLIVTVQTNYLGIL